MEFVALIEQHWMAAYVCIGVVLFAYGVVTGGWPKAGWSDAGGKPIATGGAYGWFCSCVVLWPMLLLAVILPKTVKKWLHVGVATLTIAAIAIGPLALVVYALVWAFFPKR